ncbi:unnamed protein product [Trichogramma brassicae]|uniref:Reverse transcriptase RNase H-like domain-containing protein n=1 Tax=Trichogramma brassicae TaxID=86971 RepID=A0A6H5IT76_9HYME|nr:unnamed protein product [Trichogramma brassicae]
MEQRYQEHQQIEWLSSNIHPWSQVVEYWQSSFRARYTFTDTKSEATIGAYPAAGPLMKHACHDDRLINQKQLNVIRENVDDKAEPKAASCKNVHDVILSRPQALGSEAVGDAASDVEALLKSRGKQFTVYTDHKPLLYFRNSTDPNSRVSRYQFKLQNFEFISSTSQAPNNIIADCLSRDPVVEQVNVMTRSADGLKRVNYKLTRTRLTHLESTENERTKVNEKLKNIEASDDITDQSTEKEKGEHGAVVPMTDARSTAVEIADLQNAAEIESWRGKSQYDPTDLIISNYTIFIQK